VKEDQQRIITELAGARAKVQDKFNGYAGTPQSWSITF